MHRRIIVVGVPGVGKSSLMREVVRVATANDQRLGLINFGSVMLDEAKRAGISDRDNLRLMSLGKQRRLQLAAARKIFRMKDDLLFVDTEMFVRTPQGLWPGLPPDVLRVLHPTNFLLIEVSPDVLAKRIREDTERRRDKETVEQIAEEMGVTKDAVVGLATICNVPLLIVDNKEGNLEKTASRIVDSLVG